MINIFTDQEDLWISSSRPKWAAIGRSERPLDAKVQTGKVQQFLVDVKNDDVIGKKIFFLGDVVAFGLSLRCNIPYAAKLLLQFYERSTAALWLTSTKAWDTNLEY